MNSLIGDKSEFAVEYLIDESSRRGGDVFANIKVWINNDYLGSFDEDDYLSITQNALKYISDRYLKLQNSYLYNLSDDALIELFIQQKESIEGYDEDIDIDNFMFPSSPRFDDFYCLCLYDADADKLRFVWRLADEPYWKYPNYSRNALSGFVDFKIFKKVALEFYELS